MVRAGFILLLLLFVFAEAKAQVEFFAEAEPKVVTMGKSFSYTIVSNRNGKVKPPSFNGFNVLAGPHISSFSSSSFINGVSRKTVQYSWTYELMPQQTGNHIIREASIIVKGKTYTSNTVSIRVLEGSSMMTEDKQLEPIFVAFSSDRPEIYLGEAIILSYDFYNRYERATLRDSKLTPQKGGWVKELSPASFRGWNSRQEVINNTYFEVTPLKKEVIVPNVPGKYIPEKFEMTVATSDSRYGKNIFSLVSKPFSVKVKPLPAGQPENFTGLVGHFSFAMKVTREEVPVNEGFEIIISVNGSGNLQYLENLDLHLPEELEVFKPELNSNLAVTEKGISGTKQFKFLVIPRKEGFYTSGPIRFSWFDPGKEKYFISSLPSFSIKVTPGNNENGPLILSENKKPEDENILQTVYDEPGMYFKKEDFLFGTPSFLLLSLTLPVIYFFSLLVIPAVRRKDPGARSGNAEKIAVRQLKTAQRLMNEKDIEGFYEETWRALNSYIEMKFKIEPSQLSRQKISAILSEKGIDHTLIAGYLSLIESCEFARFARMSEGHEKKIYDDSVHLIQKIEENSQ